MSDPDGVGFVEVARRLLALAAQLPVGARREAAERFIVIAKDWLERVARTDNLDPVGYEHLIAQLDRFPAD